MSEELSFHRAIQQVVRKRLDYRKYPFAAGRVFDRRDQLVEERLAGQKKPGPAVLPKFSLSCVKKLTRPGTRYS